MILRRRLAGFLATIIFFLIPVGLVLAENLLTVSIELTTARFSAPSDMTVRFTTVSAIPDGAFHIFVPTSWDVGNAAVTCPNDVDLDGHQYDFGEGQSLPIEVLRAGTMYHVFECPYSGSGQAGSVFNGTIFDAVKITGLVNPPPLAEHQPGVADTYSVLVEHVDAGRSRVDASFAEVAIVESVDVAGVVVSAVVPPLPTPTPSPTPIPSPTPAPTPAPPAISPAVPIAGLGLFGLLGYILTLFFIIGVPLGFLPAFLAALLQFWFLFWPGKKHELREQEGKRPLAWAGFLLVWLDEKNRRQVMRVVTNTLGNWDAGFKKNAAYSFEYQSRAFLYPGDKIFVSEHRPEGEERRLYVAGQSFWVFEKSQPRATTKDVFSLHEELKFRFVVWARRQRPGLARWWLFLPRVFLLVTLAAGAALAWFFPAWWSIVLLLFVLYIFARDLISQVPKKLEVYVA